MTEARRIEAWKIGRAKRIDLNKTTQLAGLSLFAPHWFILAFIFCRSRSQSFEVAMLIEIGMPKYLKEV